MPAAIVMSSLSEASTPLARQRRDAPQFAGALRKHYHAPDMLRAYNIMPT